MKLIAYVLLALLHRCVAQPVDPGQSQQPGKPQFVLDPVCKNLPNGAGDHIVTAIQDGIAMAENAVKVLTNNINDKHVQDMCKLVLGDADFANKLQQVKTTFERVAAFEKAPSPLTPIDPAWRARGSNKDVAFFCDTSRWTSIHNGLVANAAWGGRQIFYEKTLESKLKRCYLSHQEAKVAKTAPGTTTFTKASTLRSDLLDRVKLAEDRKKDPKNVDDKDRKYYTETTDANNIDVCTWWWQAIENRKWPRLNANLIEWIKTPEYTDSVKKRPDERQIDSLAVTSKTMLHELTHTNQGGVLHDVDVKAMQIPDVASCYTWRCVTRIHRVDNSDSVALLGVALQVFTLGHYVNANGDVNPI